MILVKEYRQVASGIGDRIEKDRQELCDHYRWAFIVQNVWALQISKVGGYDTVVLAQFVGGGDLGVIR